MTPKRVVKWGVPGVMILLLATVVAVAIHRQLSPSGLPASARPMAGALREPTEQEALAIRQRSLPNVAAKKRIFVATKDLRTVAVKTPMVVLLPRDAYHPERVKRWLGGPLGKTVLLFEGTNQDSAHPGGHLNAIIGAGMHYDPICQMESYELTSWETCTNLHSRTSVPGAMRPYLVPATPQQVQIMAGVQAPPSVADKFKQLTSASRITLSPPTASEPLLLIAVPAGQHHIIAGGELGLNSLWLTDNKRVIAVFSDPLCWDFSNGEGKNMALFLPSGVAEHYLQLCKPQTP